MKALKQCLKEKNITITYLSNELKIPRTTLSVFINEKHKLPKKYIERLCNFLDIDIDAFYKNKLIDKHTHKEYIYKKVIKFKPPSKNKKLKPYCSCQKGKKKNYSCPLNFQQTKVDNNDICIYCSHYAVYLNKTGLGNYVHTLERYEKIKEEPLFYNIVI